MGLLQFLGNAADKIGTGFNLPEGNISEFIARGNTSYTGSNPNTRAFEARTQQFSPIQNINPNPIAYKTQNMQDTGNGDVLGANTGLSNFIKTNTTPTVFNDAGNAAKEGTNAEIQGLNTQFDRLRSEAENQIPFLQNERSRSLSNLANELTGLRTQIDSQKAESQANTESQVADAGQIARDTQRSNRNTLRALGILNSTAAGELLSKPLNQFDKVRAEIYQEGTRRVNELDNFMNQKTAEHANLVAQIEDNYSQLIGQIQNDLRFNERERADAIRSANAALSQRIAEIQQAQFNWKTQIDVAKMQLAGELNQLQSYQAPTIDTAGISNLVPQLEANAQPQTASIYQDEKKKNGLSGLTS